ncbi:hypothetical protein Lal_00007638 [Lupinus albus]|nr:hypothetical protein Lal_00007638 [Lupinus albus]
MGKDLSDDQVSSMKEAFTLFDTDGDGKIAPSELGILMRSLGGNPTQAQLKAIAAEENLTAPFDFPRFLDLMAKHMKPEPFDRQLRDAFKVLDKESSGFISVTELRHILTSIGEKLEPAEFDEWIREVDVGSDGKIRYEDFIARMVANNLKASRFKSALSRFPHLLREVSDFYCWKKTGPRVAPYDIKFLLQSTVKECGLHCKCNPKEGNFTNGLHYK